MKKILLFICIHIISIHSFAESFEYALFSEISYKNNDGVEGYIVYFKGPGNIAMGMGDKGFIEGQKEAYSTLFSQAGWDKPKDYSVLYTLNYLGSKGWEVISVTKEKEEVFTNRYPGEKQEYFFKRTSK
jgi:hypothetical protein